jgi:two-component system cell cycle sensor histidine kinase/response regulator CckA
LSNSIGKTSGAPYVTALTPGLRTKLVVALATAVLFELCSRIILQFSGTNHFLAETLSITAVLIVCGSIAILIARTCGGRVVRWLMMLAGSALCFSILLRIFADIEMLADLPLLGARGAFQAVPVSISDLTGISAWIFGFFWLVFELDSTRAELDTHRRRLLAQIDERSRTETILRESEGRFRAVFENVPESILVMSPKGHLIESNQALATELGYSHRQLHDTSLETLVHEADRPALRDALEALHNAKNTTLSFEVRLLHHESHAIHYAISATLVRPDARQAGIVVAVLENISERHLRDRQIQRRQKMESLEILAGGVAHDFNNFLVGIMTNADHLSRAVESNPEQFQTCVDIVQSSQRAADLCQQLLAYTGKAPRQEQALALSDLVARSTQLLKMALSPKADMVIQTTPELPAISADPAQIRQVLLSLIANAADALQGEAGAITISTGIESLRESDFPRLLHQHVPTPGPHVYLEVADTGSGIPEDAISRIFDPFYTTKHQGSGLGLAAVLGIVHAHRGLLSIQSAPGEGASFRIYFQPTVESATPVEPDARENKSRDAVAPGTTILVVDDEEMVRNAARRILEHSGYTVVSAVDGQEGLDIFEARHGELAAVLLDLTMPRMNGETACTRMREINPKVPIVLSSGYSENESASPAIFKEVAAYIRKPYRFKQLLDILDEVI